jgi:hypothetical protein
MLMFLEALKAGAMVVTGAKAQGKAGKKRG